MVTAPTPAYGSPAHLNSLWDRIRAVEANLIATEAALEQVREERDDAIGRYVAGKKVLDALRCEDNALAVVERADDGYTQTAARDYWQRARQARHRLHNEYDAHWEKT